MNALPARVQRMRRMANALLLAMAALYVVARLLEATHAFWGLLRAFAEAALVGGLADWFAVTALFRHPLGLPIPHTAIIPANKDRLAEGVADFLRQNFLTRRVLAEQLARWDLAAAIVAALRDDALRSWLVQRGASLAASQLDAGALAGGWLHEQLDRQRQQLWFDRIVGWAQRLLAQHHADIYQKVSEKSPRWMPRRFNDELYLRLMDGIAEILDEMLIPDSTARLQFEHALRDEAGRLAAGSRGAALAEWLEADAGIQAGLHVQIDAGLTRLAERLDSEPALRAALNRWLRRRLVALLVRRRTAIVGLVTRVIENWDAATVADRVEARVGRDLQFIRINGTLVGGAVGLLIHAISSIF